MKTKLLIYSGGMDSTTMLHQFQDEIALAVSFDYGSKHNHMEILAAGQNCKLLDIEHKVIGLKNVMEHFKSDLLTSGGDIPEGHYAEDNMASTVVPFRNGIMLSIAAGIAESNNLESVMVASHYGDDAQYPDCRQTFVGPMGKAIFFGTGNNILLEAPYTDITKDTIAKIGDRLGIDWSSTYSCYKGRVTHCGKCGTCVERIWALQGSEDTTIYEDYDYAVKVLKEKGEWNNG